jgi:hypothetical protein
MNINYIIYILLLFGQSKICVNSFNLNFYNPSTKINYSNKIDKLNKLNKFDKIAIDKKINKIEQLSIKDKNEIQKFSLLSKLIYEYDFHNINNIKDVNNKNNYVLDISSNQKTNLTFDFINNHNVYFSSEQYVSFLHDNNFAEKTKEYFNILNNKIPNSQIYGYFCKNRLYSLILINHEFEEIVVVFRGSQYNDEWLYNFYINERNLDFNKNYSMHNGIYTMYAYNNIDKNIVYILKNLYEYFPNYRKIITGHSKGAISSILLSFELLNTINKNYNYEIYSFGNPPLFNYKLADTLHHHPNLKIYNIMNKHDIVSSIPFPFHYQIGDEIILDGKNTQIVHHPSPYKISFFDTVLNFYNSIAQHDMDIYVKNIN